MPLESPRLRLGIVAIVIVSLFAALLARLWYLQVLAAPQYRVQADVNRVRTIYTEAPRGRILDRQGRVLVDNRVSDAVVVNREELGGLRTLGTDPVGQGHDLQLRIDLDIQKLAEDSLEQGLQAARGSYDRQQAKHFIAPAGSDIVLDPRDGSVLALASNPTYDPSIFVNGIKPDLFAQLNDPVSGFPLNNRAIQGQYAPGSTFKLVPSLAALGHGMIDPKYTVDDGGKVKIGNRIFKNAGGEANGRVNVVRALTVSSDGVFYTLGYQFWVQRSQ